MLKKRNEKKTSDLPPPPEREFFDEPKATQKAMGRFQELFEKKLVRLLFMVVAVLVVLAALFYRPAKKKITAPVPHAEEKRVVVTTQSMERVIDSSARGQKTRTSQGEGRTRSPEKRKFDSAIAAYVEKPENPRQSTSKDREEEISLGIPSGTKIPALLSDRVFSFNVAAPVTAVLPKDFILQDKLLIPKDSQFLGEVNVLKSVDRINVRFDLLIFPDGRELRVRAIALSEDGSNGIKGKVNKHTDTKVLKAIGETLLAGASLFVGGRSQDPYSLDDQLRVSLADNLTNQAAQDLRSVKVDKSITVESGVRIQVMLLEAI